MGYIKHNAIVVTGWEEELMESARSKAVELFGKTQVSKILESKRNDYRSFFIGPDGSKEGWETSIEGDNKRSDFIKWLDDSTTEDRSGLRYVEVFYGEDNYQAGVVRNN